MTNSPTPMTGPEHVAEALRLAGLAEQPYLDSPGGNGTYRPTDEQRYRMLMRAHLHANLARTAAMVDKRQWNDGSVTRSDKDEQAWHDTFGVRR